jgi:hypothetical protein
MRAFLRLLAKKKNTAAKAPPKALGPVIINRIRGHNGTWKKVHLLPDLSTYGQEGYVMEGCQIFADLPDPVIQPRDYYPPEIFDLAQMPTEDDVSLKEPKRLYARKRFRYMPRPPKIGQR